ncbi:MAG: hypothetical protein CMO61_11360 [Verrucomicrobiales bacterium]|nr:hypothetical protein [Verrucomicrobiales bacterium]|tara:strand:+ start:5757 stop:6812 length:1056 start_codon:yes stop_codon:yes gene_type:complete
MKKPFVRNDIELPVPLTSAPEDNRNYDVAFDTGGESSMVETSREPPDYKPYPFALRPAPKGKIHIYFGVLVHQINKMVIGPDGLVSQTGLSNPQVIVPSNLSSNENRYKFYDLDWRGDVYLYWETDTSGSVTLCELKGPDEPEQQSLPNEDGGKFWVKIGNVAEGDGGYDISSLDQNISTDVYWITAFAEPIGGIGSGDDSSGSTSGGGGDDPSGSDKSTAIVPMGWHDKGYGALFTMESNEVLFEFVMRDVPVVGPKTVTRIDDRFLAVCEPDSMVITGVAGDRAGSVGAVVEKNNVVLSAWPLSFLRPNKVTLKLTGVRKGFKHLDMPERSREQFIANEKFINSAYPRE